MLLILADVYRIATFRAAEPPRGVTREEHGTTGRKKPWYQIAGLRL